MFVIKMLETLKHKPVGDKTKFEGLKEQKKEPIKSDPFMPPFEEGLFIDELTTTHSLVFNKFSVCDNHVIVITKEFEP